MLLTPYIRSNSLALVDVDCIVSAMNELLVISRKDRGVDYRDGDAENS